MELSEIFLAFGEKCQELTEMGYIPFFSYHGHVACFSFYVHRSPWSVKSVRAISLISTDYNTIGEFMGACFQASNLLMHK